VISSLTSVAEAGLKLLSIFLLNIISAFINMAGIIWETKIAELWITAHQTSRSEEEAVPPKCQ